MSSYETDRGDGGQPQLPEHTEPSHFVQNSVPSFHPAPEHQGSQEYQEFHRIRERLLQVIREDADNPKQAVKDLSDAIFSANPTTPEGFLGAVKIVLTIGIHFAQRRKLRKTYRIVSQDLLEKIFDPMLEFQMTKRDILDAFEFTGIPRGKVSDEQIRTIYVTVLRTLEVGEIRDLTYEEDLHRYVLMKRREIRYSRQDWDLNGR